MAKLSFEENEPKQQAFMRKQTFRPTRDGSQLSAIVLAIITIDIAFAMLN